VSKKRERVELIHDILETVQNHGGKIKPTHLLYKANLSYSALQRYVEGLISSGLLIEQELQQGSRLYALTDRGKAFLDQYAKFRTLSDSFGI
jgi:predicted transcriptional regulator